MGLQPGQVLDEKFRILRLIGEGGMGSVYEAQHAFLGRRVAIKVLAPDFAHNDEAIRRFYREAQAAAQIGHENICEVTDLGQTGGSPYIVMQLLQGKSLAKAIVESAPFPVGRAVDIAQQTLEALAAAHAAGIVHRDMKPDNIFLTKVAGRDAPTRAHRLRRQRRAVVLDRHRIRRGREDPRSWRTRRSLAASGPGEESHHEHDPIASGL